MSTNLSPIDAADKYVVRHTNVSNPSVIHSRPSQQSITASEDYYSLSGSNSSTHSNDLLNARGGASSHTITRYQTPPSRYRTPQQSRSDLPLQQHVEEAPVEEQFRKTPMRGHGERRQSQEQAAASVEEPLLPAQAQLRAGGIRRKPVPSMVIEGNGSKTESRISPTGARSSVAQDMDREQNAPTPGVDDTPYVQFALDQLTRDEEVRGSRRYVGGPGIEGDYPYQIPAGTQMPFQASSGRYALVAQEERDIVEQSPFDDPPIWNSDHISGEQAQLYPGSGVRHDRGPNVFVPVAEKDSRQPPLNFMPGILRSLQLGIYILLLVIYLILLVFAAAWSRGNTGLWRYASLGDGRYFVFQYLPTILGMILLMWLFEIQKAVYRVAPFIAMGASRRVISRVAGAKLPLQPKGFVLPYFGHFGARQPVVGIFLLVSWLQLFSIPLLGSAFNVYQDNQGRWSWLATQAVIWVVIALYLLLLIALVALLTWLKRSSTGLKWDARSLADIAVLFERSNALDGLGEGVPQLGYFHAVHRPNEVFHTYGISDKPARSHHVVDGQIREKRFSDVESYQDGGQPRPSKEVMLPRGEADDDTTNDHHHGSALPWFLRPSLALLWPIIAIVLLVAFLVASYLPSTAVANGFDPMVPASVGGMGFSSTNFLYSFIPALLAMLCLLFWVDIDLAYRHLAPFASLTSHQTRRGDPEKVANAWGDVAERTILTSYSADLPVFITLGAMFNGHWRVAFTSFISLLATSLPILAGGVFWAQFYIPLQTVRISAQMPAYYAMTVFVTIYAFSYLAIFPPSSLRHATLPSDLNTFAGIRDLFHQSRLLDDVAFRNPVSKTDLVTRLLSSSPGMQTLQAPAAAASKVSLADSVRGFGRARANAAPQPVHSAPYEITRYAYGRFMGRDGREYELVDRVRS
ncbi:hypothetical protein DOTSEDRAFT_83474 [Dothistroma septosporum NZE10]|uniref:Phosphoribosylaminoimidazole-succinocarboxamide synthase n=1 Tax=Dothistroma septosporum (strain NZE10 / CBS 128990) TaxID=675120 RepID=M2Y0E0_DOTSN|nr:hypothetical protein DOTSEDRAFT_83474 [Dothistroma septosporum NZE10]